MVAAFKLVACVICGTAVLAFLVKQYLNKKVDPIGRGKADDDDEEVFPMPDEMW